MVIEGATDSEAGTLSLENGRLSFITDRPIFDCPLAQVQDVDFPWFYFGAGCTLKVNGAKFRLSFIQPGNTVGGEFASIPEARHKGQRWQTALARLDSQE